MLLTWNNLAYYQVLMAEIRQAISENQFEEFRLLTKEAWSRGDIAALS
jgi:queuine tRNA-ribosyltransferase